jgi:RHS repeat-associated protein
MKTWRSCVWLSGLSAFILVVTLVSIGQFHGPSHGKARVRQLETNPLSSSAKSKALSDLGKLPLSFEPNVGQTDPQVSFLARGDGYELFLTKQDAVLELTAASHLDSDPSKRNQPLRGMRTSSASTSASAAPSVLRMKFEGANPGPEVVGLENLPGKSNYFLGNNPKDWHTGVPSYARIEYREVYPGVDLVFYGNQRRLEYDFIVAPGADPSVVALRIDGASGMRIDSDGNLLIRVRDGEAELRKPIVYQEGETGRGEIAGGYILAGDHSVRFTVGAYDHNKPLILDPTLDYSTYLGGNNFDFGGKIAVDSNGNAYVGGQTYSTDFPTTSTAMQTTAPPGIPPSGAFISEINSTGTALLYSTYIGGNKGEAAYGLALDSASPPNVYVTGWTCSTNFPTTSNAYLQAFTPTCGSNGGAAFVTKFNPSVSGMGALEYSTYLGGNGQDIGSDIAVDAAGNAYVTGQTYSSNFPISQNAYQSVNKAAPSLANVFITRIDPSKSGTASLIYSSYLGGTGQTGHYDAGYHITVDSNANVYVSGNAGSIDFPTTASALQPTAPSDIHNPSMPGTGFVARLDTSAAGSQSLIYSTFLGGSAANSCGADRAEGVALGPNNQTYVVGTTCSPDFPVTAGAYQTTPPSGISASGVAYLSVIDTSQSGSDSLAYSTFLGGNNFDIGLGVTVDPAGSAYIGGITESSSFPVTSGAFQTSLNGCGNSFVAELMPLGNGSADLVYSTLFDGTEPPAACHGFQMGAWSIVLDSANNVYISGITEATNFPVSPSNAFQTSLKVAPDSYVAKLSLTPKVLPTPSITSLSVTSGGTGAPVTISGTNFGMNQGASKVTFGTVVASVVSWSSTSILVDVPIEGSAGSLQVSVQTNVATSNSKSFTVLPTILSLSPTSGPVGASVTISGYNFGSSGSVTFNGFTATTTSWNSTTIVATVPSTASTGNVVVTSNSASSSGVSFTVVPSPNISSISVNNGVSGTPITINGTNFGSGQGSEAGLVVFNGASAFISSWSSTSIVAQVPSTATPGAGTVSVTAGGVESNALTFTVNPNITSFAPSGGPVGQAVVIAGADFGSTQGSGTVHFGTSTAVINSWSSTTISATVPISPNGAVSVTVTAGSVTTNSMWFTVTGPSGSAPPAAPVAAGMPSFASFGGGPADTINLGNLNVHLDIPIISKPGRGTPFVFNLQFDNSMWYPSGPSGNVAWQPVNNWGWAAQSDALLGSATYFMTTTQTCSVDNKLYTMYYGWSYRDTLGVSHPFNTAGVSNDTNCGSDPATGAATDGSGYTISVYAVPNSNPQTFNATVTSRLGRQISAPVVGGLASGAMTDRNGNQIIVSTSGNTSTYSDTLGINALTEAGVAPNPLALSYTAPGANGTGVPTAVTVNYKQYTVQTTFNCTGINNYPSTPNVPLVDNITYGDGSKYTFTYEPTLGGTSGAVTARLNTVTLPTGGSITYSYSGGDGSHNGITCADGSAAGFNRQTPDGTWTYAHSESGSAWTTTVTDPLTDQTVMNFQSIYETQRQIYQGSSSSGTLLQSITTCYNGNLTNCNTTGVGLPILRRTQTIQFPSGLQGKQESIYNGNGLQTEADDFDFGSGSPGALLRKTLTTYASLGNGIVGQPASVTIQDGSGNTKAQTTYTYDGGSLTTTSGTPNHVAVSGSRGNPTTIATLVQGSTVLSKGITYYDTGDPDLVTDVNDKITVYAHGSSSCGNSFPQAVTNISLNLQKSMTWDCNGGVLKTTTDENGQVTTTTYTDPNFWRPASVKDPTNAITTYTYSNPTSVESTLAFNSGNSSVDNLTTLDGLGRSHLQQTRQAPGSTNFDTIETDYDALGRPSRITLPYTGTAGQTNSSAPGQSFSYDAMGRIQVVSDSGGGGTSYRYNQNDVYVNIGPAPTGENAKRHQLEYDALGRLTSNCEITDDSQSGTCGQNSPVTGYWTKYAYDPLGNLTAAAQNAQPNGTSQTRAYSYDGLNRLTSETNPESGTSVYTYDTDSGCGTYHGDLVKRVDAVGNTTCFAYDALHRQLSATYSGPYAANTPNRFLVYDSATVNGIQMANAKARLVEAYTCIAPCSSKITDEGFSYSTRGEVSDFYQSTPHSGGYYHINQTYWPHGAPSQLSQLVGLPTISYGGTVGLDGEGRITQVTASSGQNPVTGVTYNNASQPVQVSLGSGDSDMFVYDLNTFRMTQYQFNVNGQSDIGALTWNANSTLQRLAITDPYDSSDNQTCSYLHDDLTRLQSVDCGTAWSQTFNYDPFGNITKSGSSIFQPNYSASTNRMTSLPGGLTPTYDSNGNVTNDFLNTYTWDANSRPVIIDAVGITYDAFGRMVEQNRSGTYTEIAYATSGQKVALMSGQTLQKAFVPLPSGSTAVYNGSGLAYYRHSDWLGSARLTTTPSRTVSGDVAYAPFGEAYAQSGTIDFSFTGQNEDTASTAFDFSAREYAVQGRWPSPDPAGLDAVNPSDPQSWNRYAYVMNNPLAGTDPTGMDGGCDYVINGVTYTYCLGNSGGTGVATGDGADVGLGGGGGVIGPIYCGAGAGTTNCGKSDAATCVAEALANHRSPTACTGGIVSPMPAPAPSKTTASPSANNGSGLSQAFGNMINFLWSVPWTLTIIDSTPEEPIGPAFTLAYNPSTKYICAGGGLGGSVGHNFSVGPLTLGPLRNQNAILSGASISVGAQATPLFGSQAIGNYSGILGGPTVGIPGGSATATYSWCGTL